MKTQDTKKREELTLDNTQNEYENIVELSPTERRIKKSFFTPAVSSLIKLLFLLLLVCSVVMFVNAFVEYRELQEEKTRLEEQIKEQKLEIEELEFLINAPIDYDYIIRVAKEKLNLYLPEETIYYSDIN